MNFQCKKCKVWINLGETGYPEEQYLACPKCQAWLLNPYWDEKERKPDYV